MGFEVLRRVASKVIASGEALGLDELNVRMPSSGHSSAAQAQELQAFCEGLFLATYRFDRHQTPSPDAPKPLGKVNLLLDNVSAATKKSDRAREALQPGHHFGTRFDQ